MPLTRRDVLLGGAALGLPWAAEAAVGLSWRGAQWVNLLPQAGAAELALPDAAFDYILERGRWSATADDDTQGESLDAGFVKDLMLAFRDHPQDRNAQLGLGLLALTLGCADGNQCRSGRGTLQLQQRTMSVIARNTETLR